MMRQIREILRFYHAQGYSLRIIIGRILQISHVAVEKGPLMAPKRPGAPRADSGSMRHLDPGILELAIQLQEEETEKRIGAGRCSRLSG